MARNQQQSSCEKGSGLLETRFRILICWTEEAISNRVNVHAFVGKQFEKSNDTARQKIGRLLHHLRSIRNIADYQDKFYGKLLARTRVALLEAEEVLRLLNTL